MPLPSLFPSRSAPTPSLASARLKRESSQVAAVHRLQSPPPRTHLTNFSAAHGVSTADASGKCRAGRRRERHVPPARQSLLLQGALLRHLSAGTPTGNHRLPRLLLREPPPSRCFPKAFSSPPPPTATSQGPYRVPKPRRDWVREWVSSNDGLVRTLPIYVGGLSLLAVLLNRASSGIAPVADASSSQSRTDLLTLALAVTNILSGLVWLSIRPKDISPVIPHGLECRRISSDIPQRAVLELLWAWESLSTVTCCRSLVIVLGNDCLLQIGVAAESSVEAGDAVVVDVQKLMQSSLYKSVMESGKQFYLANLSLYPSRSELPFLPMNTQAVLLQPLGDKGIAIIGGDTIRGFSTPDQTWITSIAEKLDATLTK